MLKTIERGAFRDVAVRGGDAFLLPARVPHSPRRAGRDPNCIGALSFIVRSVERACSSNPD